MIISTMAISKELLDEIDKYARGPNRIYPSRSELVRSACRMFFRDFLVKEDEPIIEDDPKKIKIIEENGDIVEYKIIRGLNHA